MNNVLEFKRRNDDLGVFSSEEFMKEMKMYGVNGMVSEQIMEDLEDIEEMAMMDARLCALSKFVIKDSEKVLNSKNSKEKVSYLVRCRGKNLMTLIDEMAETEEGRASIRRNSEVVNEALCKYNQATNELIERVDNLVVDLVKRRDEFGRQLGYAEEKYLYALDEKLDNDSSDYIKISDDEMEELIDQAIKEMKLEKQKARRDKRKMLFNSIARKVRQG